MVSCEVAQKIIGLRVLENRISCWLFAMEFILISHAGFQRAHSFRMEVLNGPHVRKVGPPFGSDPKTEGGV